MLLRYSIFNSLTLFVVGYVIYFNDALNYLLTIDTSRFTFIIMAGYFLLTAVMGVFREKTNFNLIKLLGNTLTGVGLIGTIVGIQHVMYAAGHAGTAELSTLIPTLFAGFGAALITTLFGMASALMISYQVVFLTSSLTAPPAGELGVILDDEPID